MIFMGSLAFHPDSIRSAFYYSIRCAIRQSSSFFPLPRFVMLWYNRHRYQKLKTEIRSERKPLI